MENSGEKKSLMEAVRAIPGGEHVSICFSCGTCVSRCLIQQRGEETYNPRRMMKLVALGESKQAYESRTTWLCSACDLCYPACPQEIHISGVINAVKELAVDAGYDSPIDTARVNEKTCVACGLCVEVCPYDAIELIVKNIPNRGRDMSVAKVYSALCMACGLCGAVCRSNSIGLTEKYNDNLVFTSIGNWLSEKAGEK